LAVTLADDTPAFAFDGYASVFGNVNAYGFAIASGAFTKTLQENGSLPILWNHQGMSDLPIGVITEAVEDKRGLKVRGQLVEEIARAREVYALMKAGAISGLSIGLYAIKAGFDPVRKVEVVTEARLREVSLTPFPADNKARIGRVLSELSQLHDDGANGVPSTDIEEAIAHLVALREGRQPDTSTAAIEEPQDWASTLAELKHYRETQRSILR
jgi:HK97 family phage prohead protease